MTFEKKKNSQESNIYIKKKKTRQPHFVVVECEFVYINFFHLFVSSWLFLPNTHTLLKLTTLKFNLTSNRKKSTLPFFFYIHFVYSELLTSLQRKVPSIRSLHLYMMSVIWFTRFSWIRPSYDRETWELRK